MEKVRMFLILVIFTVGCVTILNAQKKGIKKDSVQVNTLDSVSVKTILKNSSPGYLQDAYGSSVYAGKKTQVLQLDASDANLAQNMARMAFAKIPGLVIWEMDGAGTQVNIGTRSTDAHRSIEMNMRQNGYNTNSDIFGYPENHYSVPMQGVQDVQLVRGSAALQFGSQFGGMLNYVMKQGDSTKPFAVETEQTAGSNNFFNSYNAVGGTKGKFNYYAYYDYRHGDGWRPNSGFNYHAFYVNLGYNFSAKGSISLQFSRMNYIQQIAGGLTDAQFNQNPQQSFRARNFFNPFINIPAIIFKYQFSNNTRLQVTANMVTGQRNSVQFINTPDVKDTINTALGSYNPRQVDRDYYTGFTTEARLLNLYKLGNMPSTLAAGLRYFTEETKRLQKGTGTTGSDFDLSIVKPYGINLGLHTINYAAFAENIFQLTPALSFTPGIRLEVINTRLDGVITNATVPVAYKSTRRFLLAGAGVQYKVNGYSQLYGNISQAYRPYLYAAVTPASQVDQVDPNMKDSKGYDIDAGWRGHYKDVIRFDVSFFYLFYGNRTGLVTQKKDDGSTYLLSTNIGNSVAKGAEAYIDFSVPAIFNTGNRINDVRIFNSLAYDHARYSSGIINKSGVNVSVKGNAVENAPDWINKTGLRFQHRSFSTSLQYSFSSKSYNDAFNTVSSSNGVTGLLPAWHVVDWVFDYTFKGVYHFSGGINNLTNQKYFNRRITMYPGPGILPADGRTFYISFGIKI